MSSASAVDVAKNFAQVARSSGASEIVAVATAATREASNRQAFIQMLRAAFPRARLSLYFWDSIENAPRARRIAPLFDQVATFDPVDAEKLGWIYRPLFARAITTDVRSQEPMQYD